MRTEEEILERIEFVSDRDWMGCEKQDLIMALSFDNAKQFLKDDATEEQWAQVPRDKESLIKSMGDYMDFAWKKANDERGISAGRTMAHYNSWLWLAEEDLGEMLNYEYYGKPNLIRICDHYGWDHSQWDDGVRTA